MAESYLDRIRRLKGAVPERAPAVSPDSDQANSGQANSGQANSGQANSGSYLEKIRALKSGSVAVAEPPVAATTTAPAEAGFLESLPEVMPEILKAVGGLMPQNLMFQSELIREQADRAAAERGDILAARRLKARQIASGGLAAAALSPLGVPSGLGLGAALGLRSGLGALEGAAGSGAEALTAGEPILPALGAGAATGAVVGPIPGLVGPAMRRARVLLKLGKPVPAPLADKLRKELTPPNLGDPVQRLVKALDEVPRLQKEQAQLTRVGRARQIRAFQQAGAGIGGRQGARAQLRAMAGELPKVDFKSLEGIVSEQDADAIFNIAKSSPMIGEFERAGVFSTLEHMFAGRLPRPSELVLLERVYGPDMVEALIRKRPQIARLKQLGIAVINTPREIMSSFDLSAPLRQGLVLGAGNPRKFASAFGTMLRSVVSDKATEALERDIVARPTYELMRRSGLALTKAGSLVGEGEEVFRRGLSRHVPGLRSIVNVSERTYTNFLNKMRADVFDSMVKDSTRAGVDLSDDALKQIAGYINAASGRGNLPQWMAKHSQSLTTAFYSPRLMASRIQLLNPASYVTSNPVVRKQAIRSMLSLGGLATTALAVAKASGAEVETDMTSSDWGKIRVGNTRYDILGGFQQYLRLGAQMAQGASEGEGLSGKLSGSGSPVLPFLRRKLAPVPSLIMDMFIGKDFKGDDFNVPTALADRFTPMVLQDTWDTMQEMGWIGIPAATPAFFGVGVQTYD